MDTLTIKNKRYVLVPEREYQTIFERGPVLPKATRAGHRDAVDFATYAIARDIIDRRKAIGWTQRQLADEAGVGPEILNRAERGVVTPSSRALAKLDAPLNRGEIR